MQNRQTGVGYLNKELCWRWLKGPGLVVGGMSFFLKVFQHETTRLLDLSDTTDHTQIFLDEPVSQTSSDSDHPVANSTGVPDHSTEKPAHSTGFPERSTDFPERSTDFPDHSTENPAHSTAIPAHSTAIPASTDSPAIPTFDPMLVTLDWDSPPKPELNTPQLMIPWLESVRPLAEKADAFDLVQPFHFWVFSGCISRIREHRPSFNYAECPSANALVDMAIDAYRNSEVLRDKYRYFFGKRPLVELLVDNKDWWVCFGFGLEAFARDVHYMNRMVVVSILTRLFADTKTLPKRLQKPVRALEKRVDGLRSVPAPAFHHEAALIIADTHRAVAKYHQHNKPFYDM